MQQRIEPDWLLVPMFEAFDAVGFGEHENPRHFNTGTLFWSLTRLFGCYERVMSVLHQTAQERYFLEADIEHFIIRFRIVLNDIAFVVRQLLPEQLRGLKGPSGGTHPQNKEMSMFTLCEYLNENEASFPELAAAFADAHPWMTRLRNDRDNVVHYKSKVVIFETQPSPSFAMINAAGTQRTAIQSDGSSRLVLEPVSEFVNGQMLALHRFMHADLVTAVTLHASRVGLKSITVGKGHRISCIGIQRFKELNAIEA